MRHAGESRQPEAWTLPVSIPRFPYRIRASGEMAPGGRQRLTNSGRPQPMVGAPGMLSGNSRCAEPLGTNAQATHRGTSLLTGVRRQGSAFSPVAVVPSRRYQLCRQAQGGHSLGASFIPPAGAGASLAEVNAPAFSGMTEPDRRHVRSAGAGRQSGQGYPERRFEALTRVV